MNLVPKSQCNEFIDKKFLLIFTQLLKWALVLLSPLFGTWHQTGTAVLYCTVLYWHCWSQNIYSFWLYSFACHYWGHVAFYEFIFTSLIRDGLKESVVVAKTFQVDEAGLPNGELDDAVPDRNWSDSCCENDFRPTKSHLEPQTKSALQRSKVWFQSSVVLNIGVCSA